jgi:hypothetical protein
MHLSGSCGLLFGLDDARCTRRDGVHCGVRGMHCVVRGVSQQWPPMPSDTGCALLIQPGMGKRCLVWRHGSGHELRAATPVVGPAQSSTST